MAAERVIEEYLKLPRSADVDVTALANKMSPLSDRLVELAKKYRANIISLLSDNKHEQIAGITNLFKASMWVELDMPYAAREKEMTELARLVCAEIPEAVEAWRGHMLDSLTTDPGVIVISPPDKPFWTDELRALAEQEGNTIYQRT